MNTKSHSGSTCSRGHGPSKGCSECKTLAFCGNALTHSQSKHLLSSWFRNGARCKGYRNKWPRSWEWSLFHISREENHKGANQKTSRRMLPSFLYCPQWIVSGASRILASRFLHVFPTFSSGHSDVWLCPEHSGERTGGNQDPISIFGWGRAGLLLEKEMCKVDSPNL